MWRTDRARQLYLPNDGDRVRVHGKVEVYEARGEYQLYADSIQPVGIGALYLELERLKARLEAEGLFAEAHKRPLPVLPRVIGVVTSPGAAAFQDIQNVLRRRYPLAEVLLSPTQVQGETAPPLIVAALQALVDEGSADVILLARGGGSIEDLWAFNDERVARAVYDCPIPVVTGVGHEIDFTLVDFVSDRRAPTPSAGAELITPDRLELAGGLRAARLAMADVLLAAIEQRRQAIRTQRRSLGYLSPLAYIDNQRQRVDDLNRRLTVAVQRRLETARDHLQAQRRTLESTSPLNVLARGYAIVFTESDGKPLTDSQAALPGTQILIRLPHGQLRAVVQESSA